MSDPFRVGLGDRLTPRLRLAPITSADTDALLGLHTDPGVAAWYGGPWTRGRAAEFADEAAAHWQRHGVGRWLAHDRTDGELVGRGGLSVVSLADGDHLEVGWALRQRFWGRGLAGEMGRAALDIAFHELDAAEVLAFAEPDNINSRRVMQRLGMTHTRDVIRPGLATGANGTPGATTFALHRITRPGPYLPDHQVSIP